MNIISVLLGLTLLLQGCKTPDRVVSAVPKPPVPAVVLTDQPELLAFSVPGIPRENIVIDHEKREVRVTIPMDVTTEDFPVSLTVSPGFTPHTLWQHYALPV